MTTDVEDTVPPRPPPIAPPIGFLLGKPTMASVRSNRSNGKSNNPHHGFRLLDANNSNNSNGNNNDETGSVYSIYKQKIDSMFVESDHHQSGQQQQQQQQQKNSVQVRIEKMFTDVSIENGIPLNDIGCHNFTVDYLGSVPLNDKVTSLSGLQQPLKELYFAYKRIARNNDRLTGRLEITANGLKVQYQGEKGDLEQLNSFPTIAVWSAVKFVLNDDDTRPLSYAFLPLITDPDNIDKQQLFRALDAADRRYVTQETHSPLFAVVMRKIGVQKQLECHGFVCQTSEDAIVIAATLYKALMTHMKYNNRRKPKNRNGVTCCMSVASSTYNDVPPATAATTAAASGAAPHKVVNQVPIRPPRKKRNSASSSIVSGDHDLSSDTAKKTSSVASPDGSKRRGRRVPADERKPDLDAIVPYEELNDAGEEIKAKPSLNEQWNTYINNQQKQIAEEIKQVLTESTNMGLKRVKSLRRRNDDGGLKPDNSGDILTKVTIPRSGSFLNAGGLTRYKSKLNRVNGQGTGGSPLGFNELFNEFRLQEGLHSMDEILGVIIDPDGMSFNDLKPIYKEFLLKLAVTLTKDELYQRSKAIMRRQKKKLLRRNSSAKNNGSNSHVVCTKFRRLKHAFQKIRNRNKAAKLNLADYLDDGDADGDADDDDVDNATKLPESSISSSSYDTRHFRPNAKPQSHAMSRKQSYRRRANEIKLRRERASTSEESDFFSLRRAKNAVDGRSSDNARNKNSSSGYVSCSECSYDSDTCTCVSADKCYCSLGDRNATKTRERSCYCSLESKCYCSLVSTTEKGSLTWCGCDTDSCAESNKCYCMSSNNSGNGQRKSTIFEQLKQRGFIPSSESVTTPPKHRKLCKKKSNTKSTKSLEYMANPSEQLYFEKLTKKPSTTKNRKNHHHRQGVDGHRRGSDLGLDYDLFDDVTGGNHLGHRNGVYNTSLRTDFKGVHTKHEKISGKTVKQTTMPARECDEALSVKKSAEIAALFSDIKLSQTTDISQLLSRNYAQIAAHHHRRASYSRVEKKTACGANANGGVNGAMYSTRNGLYTIQSQSDESRRSSVSEKKKSGGELQTVGGRMKKISASSSNIGKSCSLENSLGYLP